MTWLRQTTFVCKKLGFVRHINQTKGHYGSQWAEENFNQTEKLPPHMIQENDSENSLAPLTPPRPNPPIIPLHGSFGKGGRRPKRPVSKRPQTDQATSKRPQNDLETTPPTSKRPQNDLKTTPPTSKRPQNDLKNDQATLGLEVMYL